MEVAGLLTFEAHNLWHEAMWTTYIMTPPPGYKRPTWGQLRNADAELWRRVSAACPAGCKRKPGATKTQFEEGWVKECLSAEVRHYLLPMPGTAPGSGAQSSSSTSSQPQPLASAIKRLENKLKQAEQQIAGQKRRLEGAGQPAQPQRGGGRQRRGGPEKKQQSGFISDWIAKGLAVKTKDGEPICFNFNMSGGCSAASLGQRCPKGWHVCAKASCQQKREPHSATSH